MTPSHGHDKTIVNGISRIGYMSGGKSALWNDDEMAPTNTRRAVSYIDANKDRPSFCSSPRRTSMSRAAQRSIQRVHRMGPRGNAIAEFDWSVGQIVAALERHQLINNTLIVVSSDNGGVVDDGYNDDAVKKLGTHRPNGVLRGGKYSIFEGGTRIPFVTHWPARIKPGESSALVNQVDLMRSLGALTGATLDARRRPR